MPARYRRAEDALADRFRENRRGTRDAQRATGTEKAQTAQVAEQAASDALDAIAAAATADTLAKGAVTFSTSNPTAGDAAGKPLGALWTVLSSNAIESYWELTSLGWIKRPLSTTVIPQINIGTGTFGTLAGARLAADAIDGMTITGALIRTAASGQRMEFDSAGLKSYSATDVLTSVLSAYDGNFSLSSISDSSRMLLSPAALWLQEGEVNRLAFNKFGLQVYPTSGLTAQYVSDRAVIERQVIHAITGAATGKVQMLEMSDGLSSIAATLETASPSVRDASASLSAYFDASGIPRSRAQADAVLVKEIGTFTNASDPADTGGPINVTAASGLAVNGKLVAGDVLRGNASQMTWLSANGRAYDGLMFWRTDVSCWYIYIGGSWLPNGEAPLTLSSIVVRGGYAIQAGSWVQKRMDGTVHGVLIVKRSSGALESGTTLLTLPSGWMPTGAWEGACATSQGGNADINFGQITSGGAVRVWNPAAGNQQAAWQFEFQTT